MSTISNNDRLRIEHALKIATGSTCAQRLGAVIVSSGRVLSTGFNTVRNASKVDKPYCHAEHAEVSALRRLRRSARSEGGAQVAKGATLYVARLKANGTFGAAAPCARCMNAIIRAGVARIVTTCDDGIMEIRLNKIEIQPFLDVAGQIFVSDGFYRNAYVSPDGTLIDA